MGILGVEFEDKLSESVSKHKTDEFVPGKTGLLGFLIKKNIAKNVSQAVTMLFGIAVFMVFVSVSLLTYYFVIPKFTEKSNHNFRIDSANRASIHSF